MSKEQVYHEMETIWNLNDSTTIAQIKEYYNAITGLENLSIGAKLDYLYEYVLDSMLRDDAITEDLYE